MVRSRTQATSRQPSGSGVLRPALLTAGVLLGLAAAIPAAAAELDTPSVRVEVTGRIDPACTIGAADEVSPDDVFVPAMDLGSALEAEGRSPVVPFRVECNTAFHYLIQSENGGLRSIHHEAIAPGSGFAAIIPYTVDFWVRTEGGLIRAEDCRSLQGCEGSSEGHAAFDAPGEVAIHWSTDQALLAARYEDTLTITVAVQP